MKRESGAVLRVAYTARTTKTYAISESELDTVSLLSGATEIFFTAAGVLFTLAFGFLMQEDTSSASWGIIFFATLTFLALASLAIAVGAHLKRRSLVDTVKRKSK